MYVSASESELSPIKCVHVVPFEASSYCKLYEVIGLPPVSVPAKAAQSTMS